MMAVMALVNTATLGSRLAPLLKHSSWPSNANAVNVESEEKQLWGKVGIIVSWVLEVSRCGEWGILPTLGYLLRRNSSRVPIPA